MKRRLLTIIVFLLIGAVANVAVAWACALWLSPRYEDEQGSALRQYGPEHQPIRKWEVRRFSRAGGTLIVSFRDRNSDPSPETDEAPSLLLPNWADLPAEPHFIYHSTSEHLEHLVFDARGWPLISLWCRRELVGLPDQLTAVEGGIKTGLPAFQHGPLQVFFRPALPLRPIWRNFAANTVFYALILWLAIRGPFVLRRQVRQRRGRCPNCGYPVGTSAVCTECGRSLLVRQN